MNDLKYKIPNTHQRLRGWLFPNGGYYDKDNYRQNHTEIVKAFLEGLKGKKEYEDILDAYYKAKKEGMDELAFAIEKLAWIRVGTTNEQSYFLCGEYIGQEEIAELYEEEVHYKKSPENILGMDIDYIMIIEEGQKKLERQERGN